MRTLMGIVPGIVVAAAVIAGAYHGYQRPYRPPAGPDFYTVSNPADYAVGAAREALACIIGGWALAGLIGGWSAAVTARANRGGAAITVGAVVILGVIGLAAFIPFPASVTAANLLRPIPLALAATRMAATRQEV